MGRTPNRIEPMTRNGSGNPPSCRDCKIVIHQFVCMGLKGLLTLSDPPHTKLLPQVDLPHTQVQPPLPSVPLRKGHCHLTTGMEHLSHLMLTIDSPQWPWKSVLTWVYMEVWNKALPMPATSSNRKQNVMKRIPESLLRKLRSGVVGWE